MGPTTTATTTTTSTTTTTTTTTTTPTTTSTTTATTVASGCNGEEDDWNCCSRTNQCGVGEGDCDRDYHCKSGLVCGRNNCRTFNPMASRFADCCYKPTCDGSTSARSCCTRNRPCSVGEGDCDRDSDCEGELKCGSNNCRDFHA